MIAFHLKRCAVGACLALGLVGAALAQGAWPNRPIRLVVPAPAGLGTDILARVIANHLAKSLGQPVVIDNKPGASGIIGTEAVTKSAPDGYTLLFSNASATVMSGGLGTKTPYDLMRDLAPIAQVGRGGIFLVATPDFPAADLKQFVQLVKANPGKYQYASFGNGSSAHLIMEALKNQTGMKIDHIPYASAARIMQDMQTGVVKVGWMDISSSLPLIRSGRIKPLALSGSQRTPATPEVQTMTDQGFAFDTDGWYGVFAPAGTPKDIIQRLNADINAAMGSAEMQERFLSMNISNAPRKSPEEFAATLRDDLKTWSDIVRTNGIKAD